MKLRINGLLVGLVLFLAGCSGQGVPSCFAGHYVVWITQYDTPTRGGETPFVSIDTLIANDGTISGHVLDHSQIPADAEVRGNVQATGTLRFQLGKLSMNGTLEALAHPLGGPASPVYGATMNDRDDPNRHYYMEWYAD